MNVKQLEFLSQLDQYDFELSDLPQALSTTFDIMISYESAFEKLVVNTLECATCRCEVQLSNNGLLMVPDEETFPQILTSGDMITSLIEKRVQKAYHTKTCENHDTQVSKQPLFVIICFVNPKVLEITKNIEIGKQSFHYISQVSSLEHGSFHTHFRKWGIFILV